MRGRLWKPPLTTTKKTDLKIEVFTILKQLPKIFELKKIISGFTISGISIKSISVQLLFSENPNISRKITEFYKILQYFNTNLLFVSSVHFRSISFNTRSLVAFFSFLGLIFHEKIEFNEKTIQKV